MLLQAKAGALRTGFTRIGKRWAKYGWIRVKNMTFALVYWFSRFVGARVNIFYSWSAAISSTSCTL